MQKLFYPLHLVGPPFHFQIVDCLEQPRCVLSSGMPDEYTRDDIITDLKFAIERIDSCLDKDEPISERIINVLLHPEIGYTMNCTEHMREHE